MIISYLKYHIVSDKLSYSYKLYTSLLNTKQIPNITFAKLHRLNEGLFRKKKRLILRCYIIRLICFWQKFSRIEEVDYHKNLPENKITQLNIVLVNRQLFCGKQKGNWQQGQCPVRSNKRYALSQCIKYFERSSNLIENKWFRLQYDNMSYITFVYSTKYH